VKKPLSLRFGTFILALLFLAPPVAPAQPAASSHWWPDALGKFLDQAGANRAELVRALEQTAGPQRPAMRFLLENMPEADLQSLSADYLLENVALTFGAFTNAPWHDRVPGDIFLNDILPYCCANETRDHWRARLRELCAPLVAGCATPGEAAQRLNEKLFPLVKVHYSTQRKKADQSALETMESGLASCTGLSIVLIDACRSVGVPARLAGTPMWVNMRGNHSWVEVWDGRWHFVGAAEPDPRGLDHGWFEHDASQALKDSRQHAIYAASFKKTGLSFPLDWAPDIHWVSAVNVTDRYASAPPAPEPGKERVLVEVLDHLGGQRVAARVTVAAITNSAVHFEGVSRDESKDNNDLLPFQVPQGATFLVRAEREGQIAGRNFTSDGKQQALVVISLSDSTLFQCPSGACCQPPPVPQALEDGQDAQLRRALLDFFCARPQRQASWKFPRRMEKLLRQNEPAVRRAAWEAFQSAPIHDAMKADFESKQVRFGQYVSPYTLRTVGSRPGNGWPLFIAMHGGGNAPKEVNDSQWKGMQHYYRDHPEVGGYLYLALRAPNDTWNGFYDDYVYPLVDNLRRQFLLFGDVDPDKVFILGYSHGGYGAFAIGPKEPDLFAAIHASAAAPTDGETTGKTLRNTVFTCMVGENDTAYGRIERDQKFRDSIRMFRGERKDIYPVNVQIIPDNGHTGLPDRDEILEMYPAVRDPAPRELTWLMTDKVIRDFFWLHTEAPGKQQEIDAACHDNRLVVTTTPNVTQATVLLDSRLIDFQKPVVVELNGKSFSRKLQPSLRTLCQTLQLRGDAGRAFTVEIPLPLGAPAK
jgi:transglutaminase-like putative cysteine protease